VIGGTTNDTDALANVIPILDGRSSP